MKTFRTELESMRVFLANNAKTGIDIETMQTDMELVLAYAERVATMRAELGEFLAVETNNQLDKYIGLEDMTDFEKKTKINAVMAPHERLLKELAALDRRLKDTKWMLLQAISIRKAELTKLM